MPGGGGMARDPFFTEYPLAIIERLGAAQAAVGEKWTIEGLNAVTDAGAAAGRPYRQVPAPDGVRARRRGRAAVSRDEGRVRAVRAARPAGGRHARRSRQAEGSLAAGDGEPDAGLSRRHRRRDGAAAVHGAARPELARRSWPAASGKGHGGVLLDEQPDVRRGLQPHRSGGLAGPDRLPGAALRIRRPRER